MSRCYVCARTFPRLPPRSSFPSPNGQPSSGVVIFEGPEGVRAYLRLARHPHGIPDRDRVCPRRREHDSRRALPTRLRCNRQRSTNKLARGVPSFACPLSESDRLEARTEWISEQQSDNTIAYVISLLNRKSRPDPTDFENLPQLKSYLDVWPQLVVEDDLLKHCNERSVSTRIVVPALNRDKVFRVAPIGASWQSGDAPKNYTEILVASCARRLRVRQRLRGLRP